ncbi:CPBP family intramembrane glutamic endopeptidase [Bacillus alkalicellulosilyticus]|uniref:CPBP family intramembrane glutamic endopeptidase n=1 Tax=Alkalihalobacterium alkalicellulosilyticum TaxID=1912214 RepID=UPI0014821503|nr:CPBP family intramembrane glutamic endopeptidase [Bacillus alkalicellulosilyticus]
MPFTFQFLLFLIPGFLCYMGFYYWTPLFIRRGFSLVLSFWFFLWVPVLLLLPLSLVLFYIEVGAFTFPEIVERFRLLPINGSDWIWIGAAIFITIVCDQLLEPIGKYFAKRKGFLPPSYLPAPFHPLRKIKLPPREFFGVQLQGNWSFLFIFITLHIIAMFSEEMMWRGYLLPVQELMFGEVAWVVNGLLWAWVVHACLKWHFIGMLPSMLVAPFIAQFTGSTWASFAVHAIGNSPLWILLFFGVISSTSPEQSNTNKEHIHL